jgi:hypothetical protein
MQFTGTAEYIMKKKWDFDRMTMGNFPILNLDMAQGFPGCCFDVIGLAVNQNSSA